MMKNRIMPLKVTNGVPVVPGAVDVEFQHEVNGRKFFVAYGDWATGGYHKRSRGPDQVVAYLWEWKAGNFAVFAKDFSKIDPDNKGRVMTEWKKTAANLNEWPWKKLDAEGSPTNEPTIPSSCGPVDLSNNLDTAKKAIAIP